MTGKHKPKQSIFRNIKLYVILPFTYEEDIIYQNLKFGMTCLKQPKVRYKNSFFNTLSKLTIKILGTSANRGERMECPYLLNSNTLSWQSLFTLGKLQLRDKPLIMSAIWKPISITIILRMRIRSRTRKKACSSIILPSTTAKTPSTLIICIADGRQHCRRKLHLAIKQIENDNQQFSFKFISFFSCFNSWDALMLP